MARFYRAARRAERFVYNSGNGAHMSLNSLFGNWFHDRPWVLESAIAVLGLVAGVALMPPLIFFAGAASLGRYDGASVGGLYDSLFAGLGEGSLASWLVLLGPYGLYLLFRVLRFWWRAGAEPM